MYELATIILSLAFQRLLAFKLSDVWNDLSHWFFFYVESENSYVSFTFSFSVLLVFILKLGCGPAGRG